jgi:hypothetical protein
MKHLRILITSALLFAAFVAVSSVVQVPRAHADSGSSVLAVGGALNEGQALGSTNGLYYALLQTDGNFVVYGPTGALWSDHIKDFFGPNHLLFQSDGNLVAYLWNNYPLWATSTQGTGAAYLIMQDDGNLVMYTSNNTPVWATNTSQPVPVPPPDPVPPSLLSQAESSTFTLGRDGGISVPIPTLNEDFWIFGDTPEATLSYGTNPVGPSVLGRGQFLNEGQAISSPNGLYMALLQADGNFVLYGPNGPMWADHIKDYFGPNHLVFQADGNLVAYLWNNYPLWATGTSGSGATYMVLQNDGNLVMYDASNHPVWATNTSQPTNPPMKWSITGFITNATAAEQSLSGVTNSVPQSLSEVGGLSQFMSTPTDLYVPNTSTPCTAGSNGVIYPARWVAGATLLPPSSSSTTLLITYDEVCVMGSGFYPEGWGYALYNASTNQMMSYNTVFAPQPGAGPDYIHTTIGQPVVDPHLDPVTHQPTTIDFYEMCTTSNTNGCRSTLSYSQIAISSLTAAQPDLASMKAALQSPSGSNPTGTLTTLPNPTGVTTTWNPFLMDVHSTLDNSEYYMVEQTDLYGHYTLFKSSNPTSGWTAYSSGVLPNCTKISTGQYCYAVAVHPEIGSNSLYVSYFDPAAGPDPGLGHLVVVSLPNG